MPLKKLIASSGIFLFYITALTAQVTPQKTRTITNVVSYQVYQQKKWNMKQLPKNSVLYQYYSKYSFHHDVLPNESLRLSPPNISFTLHSSVRLLSIPGSASHLNISERLQLHLKKNLLQSYRFFHTPTTCWDPDFFIRYEVSFSNKTFFKYQ